MEMEGRDTSHQVEEWGDDSARPQKHAVKVQCKCCRKTLSLVYARQRR